MEHSGGNPSFSTMLYIDRERNIGTFAATNISSDSPVNAARSAYKLMAEGKFEHMSASPSLDSIAAPIAVVFLLLLVLLVVLPQEFSTSVMIFISGYRRSGFHSRDLRRNDLRRVRDRDDHRLASRSEQVPVQGKPVPLRQHFPYYRRKERCQPPA